MAEFTVSALQKCVYNNTLYTAGDEFLFEADKASDVPKHMKILHAPKAAVQEKTASAELAAEEAESGKQSEETEKTETKNSAEEESARPETASEDDQKAESEPAAEKNVFAAQPKKKSSKR